MRKKKDGKMLFLISIGLSDKKDISLRALEKGKECDVLYLEGYTSYYGSGLDELSELFGKEIIELERKDVESSRLVGEASDKKIGLLVVGDALSATTHVSLMVECKEKGVEVFVVHGSSIFSAVAETGLSLYNFGRVISIPFDNADLKKPYSDFLINKENGMHTLFLLDLKDGKYMTVKEALDYLVRGGLKDELVIGCSNLGSSSSEVKIGKVSEIIKEEFKGKPQCLVIPGKMQFYEEEAIRKINK